MAEPEFSREFDFLPNLPKSNLDDRTFEDLVQECILRIPRYCPDWTNHNPGDPGITLIELFSWLVKQMLFRFNQVPRRNYVAFLELLGIRLQPPASAQVDLTFYLVKAQNSPLKIAANTEVATMRTETEPAVVFTTEEDLVIGQPKIRRLFTSRQQVKEPSQGDLSSPLRSTIPSDWGSLEEVMLFEDCSVGNCFYIVLSPTHSPLEDSIKGNVIALTFKGIVAGTTGINPDNPPLRWEAWDGEKWRSQGVLRQRQDDKTRGFSFHELRQQGFNPEQDGTDVILHLPPHWQETDFGNGSDYQGYWIRCVYIDPGESQGVYSYSPMINGMSVRSIGGTIHASECVRIRNEATEQLGNGRALEQSLGILLGVSDGKPGQVFQLQEFPVLDRKPEEHIQVKLPDDTMQVWQEVADFGNSGADDLHYTIDSLTGVVQFGPLIREPTQIQRQMQQRMEKQSQIQPWGKQQARRLSKTDMLNVPLLSTDLDTLRHEEWQYGKIPPIGSEIYISAYRVGGGSRGNVQEEKLTVLKTAIPYVKRVVNYDAAQGGKEGESLDEAVIRVPEILRTSRAAIIPEDFENIAKRSERSIHRAHCPPDPETPGVVRLLVVPNPSGQSSVREIDFRRDFPQGIHPDQHFTLEALGREKLKKLEQAIAERKPLGIQVKLDVPAYVGVKVIAEVLLEPQYNSTPIQTELRSKLLAVLYRFLNPITGGFDQQGWMLGRALSPSDVVALLQEVPEVRYVGAVKLFSIRKHPLQGWLLNEYPELLIHPGEWGLFCSWEADRTYGSDADSGHIIHFME
jgi:predicted phage baseplate assembly protein